MCNALCNNLLRWETTVKRRSVTPADVSRVAIAPHWSSALAARRSGRASVESLRRDRIQRTLRDKGYGEDAPQALVDAANGLAQAVILRDSAWQRIGDLGGPLTAGERERPA